MFKFYKRGALTPLMLVTYVGITIALLHNGANYKSEWFVDDGFVATIVYICLFSLIVSLISSTMFFCRSIFISKNKLLSLLAWMLLPLGLISYILYEEISSWMIYPNESSITLELFIIFVGLAHTIALLISYIQFHKKPV